MQERRKALVTIEALTIRAAPPDDGVAWFLALTVGGSATQFQAPAVHRGQVWPVGHAFLLMLGPEEPVDLAVVGTVLGGDAGGESLPGASLRLQPADDWETGQVYTLQSAPHERLAFELSARARWVEPRPAADLALLDLLARRGLARPMLPGEPSEL